MAYAIATRIASQGDVKEVAEVSGRVDGTRSHTLQLGFVLIRNNLGKESLSGELPTQVWGPQLEQATYKNRQRLYLSEQTDGSVPNTLVIAYCEIVKPRVAAAEHISQFNEEARSPYAWPQSLCSSWPCMGYAPCGAVGVWPSWILSGLGLGLVTYCVARACGPIGTIRHHWPRTRIVTTVPLPLFPPSDERSDTPCCILHSKKFESMKHWNNRFFSGLDARLFCYPLSWLAVTSVVKIHIRGLRLLTFLFGLSRSFTDTDVHPTLLHDNDEEMGLLDFVKSADPFKVKVEERTLAENEVPLITETEDRVISPSAQIVSLVDHNIHDELNVNSGKRKKRAAFVSGSPLVKMARTEGIVISDTRPSTAGKSPTAMRRLIRQGEQAAAGSRSAAAATEDITSSSVTPTPEHALEDVLHDNLRTRPPTAGVSVPTAESAGDGHPASTPEFETGTLSATPSHGSPADDFYESQTVDSATAMNVYVPNWNVTNNARIDNPGICRNLLDHVTAPGYWAALQSEAVKVEELRKRVFDLEALVAVKFGEVASLTTHNASLLERVSAVELERDSLKSQVVDARIADVRRDMDNDLYLHMLTAIAGRRWVVRHGFRLAVYKCACPVECRSALGKVISMAINKGKQQGLEAGIVHGKAGRSLAQVEAYDPEVGGRYVAAVFEFKGVSFPLLDELESLKDSPLALIMRGLCPPSSSNLSEASGSVPPPDTSLGVTDYQVSTLVLASDEGPANQPPVTQPHDDLFDTSVLDKPGDV
ncbi:hypothetical protein Tco_0827041 [Tanacetum coccineum]